MKQAVMAALVLLGLVFLLPMLLFGGGGMTFEAPVEPVLTPPPEITPLRSGGADGAQMVTLYRTAAGRVEQLSMEAYLWGVVAAEMPASFHAEALKAQAVAARTYALRKGGSVTEGHPDAMLCDDHTCCQAYCTREQAAANWGEQTAFYTDKVTAAVAQTDGMVLTYGGELIDAVFHSSSAGSTADAAEVWGNPVAYLQPVFTPEGEEVPNYRTTVTVPLEEVRRVIETAHPEAVLGKNAGDWFGETTLTAAGAVNTLEVGGVPLRGTELRSLFGLRSARFTVTAGAENVTFSVVGYGHGAGMSQYGANAMAGAGADVETILKHYYTGVAVERMGGE